MTLDGCLTSCKSVGNSGFLIGMLGVTENRNTLIDVRVAGFRVKDTLLHHL